MPDTAAPNDPQETTEGGKSARAARVHLQGLIRKLAEAGETRLPPERDLAERFGVSRPTLRRALAGLEEAGLVWRHVGRGTFIAPQANRISLTVPPVAVTMADVIAVRIALEGAAAAAAARRRDPAMVAELRALAAKARNADTWRAYEVADAEFHLALSRASANMVLAALLEAVEVIRRSANLMHARAELARPPADHPSFAEHDQIVAAIAAGQAGLAQAAMEQHLASVQARFRG